MSQAKACGIGVKTSSCKVLTRLVGLIEARLHNDSPRVEIDLPHACFDQGEQETTLQLEDVVRDARLDVRHPSEGLSVGALDVEADELEDVVLARLRRRQCNPVDLQERAPRSAAVEADHAPSPGALRLDDLGLVAVDVQLRADREALRVLTAMLNEECALDTVRLADAADLDAL